MPMPVQVISNFVGTNKFLDIRLVVWEIVGVMRNL